MCARTCRILPARPSVSSALLLRCDCSEPQEGEDV